MLNIAVCDDNKEITGKIEMMLQKIAKNNFIDIDIEVFWDGEGLANAIVAGERFDIIYVTSHENYMRDSFEVRPFQFLVKPVNEKQMEIYFKAAYEEIIRKDYYFRYSYKRVNNKVLIRDILYFESNKRKIFIITENETFELYGKLNEIENSLKNCKASFLRVHQSFLVNYKHIKGQSYDSVIMSDGKRIAISEDRRKKISEQYCAMEDTFYVAN